MKRRRYICQKGRKNQSLCRSGDSLGKGAIFFHAWRLQACTFFLRLFSAQCGNALKVCIDQLASLKKQKHRKSLPLSILKIDKVVASVACWSLDNQKAWNSNPPNAKQWQFFMKLTFLCETITFFIYNSFVLSVCCKAEGFQGRRNDFESTVSCL